jgi:phosphoglycolate phosphatase-like HAD superfamily hydrolase
MPVLLFDIDGTLLRSGRSGKAAMDAALRNAFGVAHINDVVPFSGRTDRAISRDLLAAHNLPVTLENERRLTATYLELLPQALAEGAGHICPGVEAILEETRKASGVLLGLLTGNVREGARRKLGHFGLWDYFPAGGGFGDDHYERDDVARSAMLELAKHHRREHHGDEIWVIGDTPLDVSCAKAIGARSVAVATGWHSLDELAACKPDAVFSDLTEAGDLVSKWLG